MGAECAGGWDVMFILTGRIKQAFVLNQLLKLPPLFAN